jgi:thioredoxin reductase (NADPH)
VIGAGPAGLAAAIAARRRGLGCVLLEKGALVNSLLQYPTDMVFFTTPELLEIGGVPFVSPHEKPTRQEALRYYRRVTDLFELDVRFGEPVVGLTSAAGGEFVARSAPVRGEPTGWRAQAVIVATGAYDLPNRIGVPGEDLPHVSHYYREPHPYFRRRVLVVGGKNSAAEAALDLYRSGVHVTLVHRGAALSDSIKYWVKPDIENRIKEGSIRAHLSTCVLEITPDRVVLRGPEGRFEEPADGVLLLTGYRSDTTLLRQAGAAIDESLAAPPPRSGDLRDDRAEPVRDRRLRGRPAERPDLHRERPLPRRSGGAGNREETPIAADARLGAVSRRVLHASRKRT